MKILINLYVPAIQEYYDILVPDFLPVQKIIPIIVKVVENLSNHFYVSSGEEKICFIEQQSVLKNELSLRKNHVQNGDNLMLV